MLSLLCVLSVLFFSTWYAVHLEKKNVNNGRYGPRSDNILQEAWEHVGISPQQTLLYDHELDEM